MIDFMFLIVNGSNHIDRISFHYMPSTRLRAGHNLRGKAWSCRMLHFLSRLDRRSFERRIVPEPPEVAWVGCGCHTRTRTSHHGSSHGATGERHLFDQPNLGRKLSCSDRLDRKQFEA
jgi:hypothetical protein